MINRITLNLKEAASDTEDDRVEGWSMKTFEHIAARTRHCGSSATEYGWENSTGEPETDFFAVT
ncbi:hypothetical protein AAF712_009828, partial [Marasmius tenuissimus]